MLVITLPSAYGYVGLAASGALWLNFIQSMAVVKARKTAKVAYPNLYAEKAEAAASKDAYVFNCVQRSHQNLLEGLPSFLVALLFSGLKHPKVASILGALYLAGRVIYHIGYSSGEPKKRFPGAYSSTLAAVSLYGLATYTAISLIQSNSWQF